LDEAVILTVGDVKIRIAVTNFVSGAFGLEVRLGFEAPPEVLILREELIGKDKRY
jgi:sRNA-binding carbon storage regulator CsrA